jgi:protein TonB
LKSLFILAFFLLLFCDSKAQTSAHFPGGEKGFNKFLAANIKWPASQEDTFGKVLISFTVQIDGRLTSFKIEKSLGKVFDGEALRVMKKSPKWVPATKNGLPVKSKQFVPINFTLTE